MWHFLFKLIAIVVIDLLYYLLQIRRKYTKIPFLSISKHSITIKTHIVRTYKEKNNIIFQIVSTLQVSVFIWSAFLGVSLSLSLWQLIILFLISIVCIGHRHARTRSLNWAVCVHCTIALTHAFILWQTHIHLILILSCISFCAIVLFHFYLCVHIGISETSVRIYLMNWITHLLAVHCTHKYVCFRIRWK